MCSSHVKQVEQQTLLVFKRGNPTMREYTRDDEICRSLRKREQIILANLGFHPEFFRKKTVFDAGFDTGDVSFLLADWTQEQIAYDNFVAPHITATIGDWLLWLKENNLKYFSSYPSFFSLRIPSHISGAIEDLKGQQNMPKSRLVRVFLTAMVQLRWTVAFHVGGLASISFIGKKRSG